MPNNSKSAFKTEPETVAVNVALPKAVHAKLRLKALREDMTLAEAITAAVKGWTAR